MRIRDRDAFFNDVQCVFTNHAYVGVQGLEVDSSIENTIHEYAHFVTLGMRCLPPGKHGSEGSRPKPRIYERVGDRLGRWPKPKQELNEIRTLAVELLVLRACGAVHPLCEHDFLKSIANADPSILHLKRRVFRLLRTDYDALEREARLVVRRIRDHARAKTKAERKDWLSDHLPR